MSIPRRYLIVLIQALTLSATTPPDWVLNQGTTSASYPRTTHLIGFGISSPSLDEAKARQEAVARAREELASSIRTQVDSEFVHRVTIQDKSRTDFARNIVKTKSSLELEGLDQYEYFVDTKKGLTYCLAILDKDRAASLLKDRIQRQNSECVRLFAKAKAGNEAQGLVHIAHLVRKLEGDLVVYRVLSSQYPEGLAYPSLEEISRELKRVFAQEPGLDGFLDRVALDLGLNLPEGIRILVDRLNYADTKFSGTLSAYLEQGLSEKLVTLGNARIIDKSAFKDLLVAQPDLDIGTALQSQAVIHGNYFDLGKDVKLTLHATSNLGDEIASASILIPVDELRRAKLTLVPENLEEARKALAIYDAKVQGSKLQVKLVADRGDGGLYRRGEKLYLFLKANQDCYAKILYHQVDGTRILIFPNKFHPDARIEKDRLYQIPPGDTAFSFEVVPPFGAEMIKVFASTSPIDINTGEATAEGFSILKEDAASITQRTRGIAVKKGEALYAEDTVVINTFEPSR